MKNLFPLTLTLVLALPFAAQAQTASDDIKVASVLTSAGIQMRGFFAKAYPLPSGNWEVLARFDEKYELTNRDGALPPASKVVLTLLNKDPAATVAAAVLTYSPDVTRIRWPNAPCEAPANSGFADAVGTNPGSIDFVCVTGWYRKAGFKKFISESAGNSNNWIKTYLPPLVPFLSSLPDAYAWMTLNSTHDRGRTYNMTLFARLSAPVVLGDSLDQSVRLWANGAGKALVAAHNADPAVVPEFPAAAN